MSALSKAVRQLPDRRSPDLTLTEFFSPANNFKYEMAARADTLAV